MKDYYQLIVLTADSYSFPMNYVCISSPVELINDHQIKYQNQIIDFEYLIFTATSLISNFRETNILHEAGLPVTNFFLQTNFENIYFAEDERLDEVITNIQES